MVRRHHGVRRKTERARLDSDGAVQEQSDDFVVSEAFAAKFLQLFAQRKQEETSPVDKYRLAMEALAVEAIKHAGAVATLKLTVL